MTILTSVDIFSNPTDLSLLIKKDEESGKYSVAIRRGPGREFKPLYISPALIPNLEEAVFVIGSTLRDAYDFVTTQLQNPHSFISTHLAPPKEELDSSKLLSMEMIEQIEEELRRNQVANTYEMFANVT